MCKKNGEYAQRNFYFTEEVKGKVIRENLMGDHKLTYDEQITNLIF
jgi:hypothetical protein